MGWDGIVVGDVRGVDFVMLGFRLHSFGKLMEDVSSGW
jgi:hypothetical protein